MARSTLHLVCDSSRESLCSSVALRIASLSQLKMPRQKRSWQMTQSICSDILSEYIATQLSCAVYPCILEMLPDSDTADDLTQVPVGILEVVTEDIPPVVNTIGIILEGNIVVEDILMLSEAICLLFGLIYGLHLDYPKGILKAFEFIQKILMNHGQQKFSPKLQTLKNALLG